MAKSLERYKDLNYALRKFRGQVSESIPYAIENFPSMSTPEEIFDYLKKRTTYVNDPKGRELFQTLPTLFENNEHGIPGAGDCDCFTIAALATLIANGFKNCGIVLGGRNPFCAVHIWAYVDDKGKRYALDLTNKKFDTTRIGTGPKHYSYTQYIPYKLNQYEKDMLLQLADGPGAAPVGYVWMPSSGVQVREDYFDGLSAGEFQNMMLEEGYGPYEIQELSKGRAQRQANRQAKKAAKQSGQLTPRQQRRMTKKAAKPRNQRKMIKAQSKADARIIKQQSKADARIIKARQPAPAPPPPEPMYMEPEYETFDPMNPPEDSPEMYMQPEQEQYEVVEYETEPTPEEQYEEMMESLMEGETRILGMSVPKALLTGLVSVVAGAACGVAVKKVTRYRRVA